MNSYYEAVNLSGGHRSMRNESVIVYTGRAYVMFLTHAVNNISTYRSYCEDILRALFYLFTIVFPNLYLPREGE